MFSVNTPGFLLFMAVLLLVWYRLPAAKRWYAMLAAGIVFYLSLDIPGFFVLLLHQVYYLSIDLCGIGPSGHAQILCHDGRHPQ